VPTPLHCLKNQEKPVYSRTLRDSGQVQAHLEVEMAKVYLTTDEWWPVVCLRVNPRGYELDHLVEVPDELLAAFIDAESRFSELNAELLEYHDGN
jgi:hypothetical protein